MEIHLDHGSKCTISVEPRQVVLRFKLGTSTLLDMAITKAGARKFAEALMAASQKDQTQG